MSIFSLKVVMNKVGVILLLLETDKDGGTREGEGRVGSQFDSKRNGHISRKRPRDRLAPLERRTEHSEREVRRDYFLILFRGVMLIYLYCFFFFFYGDEFSAGVLNSENDRQAVRRRHRDPTTTPAATLTKS